MKTLRVAARLLGTVAGLTMAAGVAAQTQQGVTKDEILLGTILDLSGPAASDKVWTSISILGTAPNEAVMRGSAAA